MVQAVTKNNGWRAWLWLYAPLILWIIAIFIFSSSAGSMSSTSRIIRPLLIWLFPDITETTLMIVHGYVRKSAHFITYAVLGFLAARAFYQSLQTFLQKYWFPLSLALVVLIASIDETNQSFNLQRTGSAYDVLLDTSGGLFALACYFILCVKNKIRV
jgi:VanZ family protein